jgi:predicted DNA-binding transcriptional regulator AlpA
MRTMTIESMIKTWKVPRREILRVVAQPDFPQPIKTVRKVDHWSPADIELWLMGQARKSQTLTETETNTQENTK